MCPTEKRPPPADDFHEGLAEEKSAVGDCDFLTQPQDNSQAEQRGARLIIGAAYIGWLIETYKNDARHCYAARTTNPKTAVPRYRAIAAAFGVDPPGCTMWGIGYRLFAHVTQAGMNVNSGRGAQYARELLHYGVALAFRPLQGPDLAWVDLLDAPLPKESVHA
jgi:hypothetical protein